MATSAEIAAAFLDELHAPKSEGMVRAVTAWLRMESGSTIIGGNPWNISYGAAQEVARKGGPAPISFRVHSKTGQKFAVYASSLDGARAAARLLLGAGNDWRGYDKVVAAARKADPIGFLNALAASAWDAGRYGTKNGGANKLLAVYQSVGGSVTLTDKQPVLGGLTTGPGESPIDAAGHILGNLLNPAFWLRVFLLILGGFLFLFGSVNVVRSTAS